MKKKNPKKQCRLLSNPNLDAHNQPTTGDVNNDKQINNDSATFLQLCKQLISSQTTVCKTNKKNEI